MTFLPWYYIAALQITVIAGVVGMLYFARRATRDKEDDDYDWHD